MRAALRALLPFALHAVAREVDAALGVLLHTTLDVPGLAFQALGLVAPLELLRSLLLWLSAGAAVWIGLAWALHRTQGASWPEALRQEAGGFDPLYLRPALTLAALASVTVVPSYPYGSTLAVALTQDWGIAQDLAAAAALAALRLRPLALPAPRPGAVFFMAFLAYALLTPERARHWDGHPGNEPKYLRMGVALGHDLSLDVSQVTALPEGTPPMESLAPLPFLSGAGRAATGLAVESGRMAAALARGPEALRASAIRARRLARQTVEGKDGGVYHVLAPGPSLLLAPTLRLDRAINLARGTPGRVAVTVLAWNAMAAALVAAAFALLREATGRPGLAALLAAGLALVPPSLFYFFQFYPEMPGALVLTAALWAVLFRPPSAAWGLLGFGSALAFLPWLHQKFLPVWGVLVVMAVLRAVDALVTLRGLLALLVPQAASLYLTGLWNFAITGSVRPDAAFLAWGPGGVTSARVHEGALGLLLDARYGLLPLAPVFVLAAGAAVGGPSVRRLLLGLPAALAYYLTVAAADNWSGAVCNLGRYVMPVVPFLVALGAAGLVRLGWRRGVLALALTAVGWTGLLAWKLWQDPRAANDSALLLARSAYVDPHAYVPDLFFRSPHYRARGHGARTVAWIAGTLGLGLWLRRCRSGRAGASPAGLLIGLTATILAAASFLEGRSPAGSRVPRFPNRLEVAPGVVAFVTGPGEVRDERIVATRGRLELLVRTREPLRELRVTAGGEGFLGIPGAPAFPVRPTGTTFDLPLEAVTTLEGRRGGREALGRGRIHVRATGAMSLALAEAGPP